MTVAHEVSLAGVADFLLARVAEDEEAARECLTWIENAPSLNDCATHHAPGRVLAECEAKRRIVERYQLAELRDETDRRRVMAGGYPHRDAVVLMQRDIAALKPVVQLLALPYAEHPDYLEVWRP